MSSVLLTKVLCIFDAVVVFVCLYEHNYPKALYWLAGSLLQLSIILGFK
jgi:hypothetical protein